ncbi:MAG: hypothetical protein EBX41_07360, partial [Chitinophagia bacterium]|nr:hypothetical protein [Chitinophagia bacterium]
MRTLSYTLLSVSLLVLSSGAMAQTKSAGKPSNIYKIKQAFLQEDLHNPAEKEEDGEDNDLARFNRWFNFVEPRC